MFSWCVDFGLVRCDASWALFVRFLLFVSAWLSGATGFAFRLVVWLVIFVWLGW